MLNMIRALAASRNRNVRRRGLAPSTTSDFILDHLESRTLLSAVTVTSTLDIVDPLDGVTTLREAINEANANALVDTIDFNLPGTGIQTILVNSSLPTISTSMTIDGTTQSGYAGTPLVELLGNGAGEGLYITAGGTTIRGLSIYNFNNNGIRMQVAGNNTIEDNYIGVVANGTIAFANVRSGIRIDDTSGNVIRNNVIAGNNNEGVNINGFNASNNLVEGNYIGVLPDGATAFGNRTGVSISGGFLNTIRDNVISGNDNMGVSLSGNTNARNVVEGNIIGLDATGSFAVGNGQSGILFTSFTGNNTIGGTTAAQRNIISGNDDFGVFIANNSDGNLIQGNYIGSDITGTIAIGNEYGILFGTLGSSSTGDNNTIDGNLISGNIKDGVLADGDGNILTGNLIGTDASGTSALGNGVRGVVMVGAQGYTVSGNTIAFNTTDGIALDPTSINNTISGNSIFDNGGLGIDLGIDGPTANDAGDADSGANGLQNFPVIVSAKADASQTTIEVELTSTALSSFTVELFSNSAADASGFGEGAVFLGQATVVTDGSGFGSATVVLPTAVTVGDIITATATDAAGNTSEFSEVSVGATVIPGNEPPVADAGGPYAVDEGGSVVLDGSGSSDADQPAATLTYEWDLDGDGIFGETGAAAANGDEVGINPIFNAASLDDGVVNIQLRVTDDQAEIDTAASTVTVNNVDPVIDLVSLDQAVIDENGSVTLSGEFTDPGIADTYTVTILWGDGDSDVLNLAAGSDSFSIAHQYLDDGLTSAPSDVYDISVTVADDDTGSDDALTSITVNNVDPVINAILGPSAGFVGQSLDFDVDFSDVGTLDTHDFAWTILDSSSTVVGSGATQQITFVPTVADSYTIEITVTDDDTGSASASQSLDIEGVLVSGDFTFDGFTGSQIFSDGIHAFRVELEGAGSVDLAYTIVDGTLTITDNDATDSNSNLIITDLLGNGFNVDAVAVDTNLGSLETNIDVGTLQLADDRQIGLVNIDGGAGTIGHVEYLEDFAGAINILANVDLLSIGDDMRNGSALAVTGNVDALTIEDDARGTIDITGNLVDATIGDTIFNSVTIDGDLGTLTARDINGDVTITGNPGTINITDKDLNGDLTIDGSLGSLSSDDDITGDITITGDVDDISAADDITGDIYIGGDADTITAGDDIRGDITIDGSVNLIGAGDNINGLITIGGDAGTIEAGGHIRQAITVNGNLVLLDAEGNIIGDVTVGGNLDTVEAHNTTGVINVGGDLGSITTTQDIRGDVIVGGMLGAITAGDDINGDIVVTGLAGTITAADDINGAITLLAGGTSIIAGDDIRGDILVVGSIDTISAGDNINAEISVTGDVTTLTSGGHMRQAIDINGNVVTFDADGRVISTVDIGGDVTTFNAQQTNDAVEIGGSLGDATIDKDIRGNFTVDGSVGTLDVNDDIVGDLTVGGSVGTLSVTDDVRGAINVTGDVTTFDIDDDLKGTVNIGGSVTTMSVADDIERAVDIAGNLDSLTIGDDLRADLHVGGDAGAITVGDRAWGDVTIDGDLDSFTVNDDFRGTLNVGAVVGTITIVDGDTVITQTFTTPTAISYDGLTGVLTVL